ncbi:NAD(P)H-hydrate dehydratase [Paenibacillus hamazuiensis]|uniref:NAD(P)H-hydrate dehydratase n=1 Tax=Paenibacillus hamazuiensis TaxID=2936508 RepID=UPI00200CBDED|nr:NAD(P)H-hydrate dehydratase [Paenibacillus hamazuiensis]
MYVVTAEEMRALDRYTIDLIGIPALVLMENAGRAVAEEVERIAAVVGRRWLILAGKGNNGADGLVCARHLLEAGLQPMVVYAADPRTLTGEAAVQRDIAAKLGVPCVEYDGAALPWHECDGVVDALLGTGTSGPPRGIYARLVEEANASGKPIVAVDIPSGLDADTGEVPGPCIRAVKTVALAFKKRGLVQYPGADYAGDVVVRFIGIPSRLAEEHGVAVVELGEQSFLARLRVDPAGVRPADTHKGSYGHVLVAAGSRAMSGAGLLAATAALRGGCGLATWALPDSLVPALLGRRPELMLAGVADGGSGDWSRSDPQALLALAAGKQALVIGPGMGRWPGDSAWLRAIWEGADLPLVIDADALNMIADAADFGAWPARRAPAVLTPHPGEMARLAGIGTREVQRDRIGLARRYAMQHGVTLVLKGARTVCAAPSGEAYVGSTGNAGMATAGAGDVLAGVIGALLAQGLSAVQAAALGVYAHGAAGDRAAAGRRSAGSLIAGDIIAEL